MKTNKMPWPSLLLLAFVACIAMISELLPAGFLQEMAGQYQVPLGQMSLFIGTYAIMSAVVGIPVTRLFSHVNRRYYLIAVCLAYAAANFVIAWAPQFYFSFCSTASSWVKCGCLVGHVGLIPGEFLTSPPSWPRYNNCFRRGYHWFKHWPPFSDCLCQSCNLAGWLYVSS